jgi:hypothetical protein
MTARFASNLMTLVVGVFILAASLGFHDAVIGWLGFAAGCVATITVLCAFAVRGRGGVQRVLDTAALLVGAWLIIASRAFPASTVKWLTFADGVLLIAISVIGLVAHEILVEMALAVRDAPSNGRAPIPQDRAPAGLAR